MNHGPGNAEIVEAEGRRLDRVHQPVAKVFPKSTIDSSKTKPSSARPTKATTATASTAPSPASSGPRSSLLPTMTKPAASAGERLNVTKLYADYRDMLTKEKPGIVCIGPRWLTSRAAMVQAAAEAGCHIYCEKPFAADLVGADAMQAACKKAGVRLALAHQWCAMPPVQKVLADLRAGKFGKLLRMRARPKDDARGGGEELLVHGTHWFDLMIAIAGPPRWVSGHVSVAGLDATRADRREGSEPVGPVAGDSITAVFGFDGGVAAFSIRQRTPRRRKGWLGIPFTD